MLPHEVCLRDAAAAVPSWGWLRQPHRNITVPVEHEQAFLVALGGPSTAASVPSSEETLTALENMRREAKVLSRSRNRPLPDRVINASKGICNGCLTNYSLIEPRWASLLEGHHVALA
jgi:hypothetical protein